MSLGIKKKDMVMVISGVDRGKRGEVLEVIVGKSRAIVAKINTAKKHVKPTREEKGGIQIIEKPISLSKLQLVCSKCSQPVRPKMQFLADNSRVRVCRKCGEQIL